MAGLPSAPNCAEVSPASWAEVSAASCAVVSRLTLAVVRAAIVLVGSAAICAGVRLETDAIDTESLQKSAQMSDGVFAAHPQNSCAFCQRVQR
jgi:hypothetical protein